MARKGEFRDRITDAVDAIESELSYVIEPLEEVENIANYDDEAVGKAEIQAMQGAIIEALKAGRDMADGLY